MTCGERIEQKRKELGLTLEELGKRINVSSSGMSKYEKNKVSISADKLLEIANVLGVSVDYLLGNTNIANATKRIEELCINNKVSELEYNLIFDSLINDKIINLNLLNSENPKIRKLYSEILNLYSDYFMTDSNSKFSTIDNRFIGILKDLDKNKILNTAISNILPITESIVQVPVIGKISAGMPILAVENIIDCAFAPASKIKEGYDYFYLVVQGDSMNRKFDDGDLILVQKQDYIDEKEIGVFLIDSQEATVKQFREQKGNIMILDPMSTNPVHIAQMYDIKQTPVLIIGKVISYQGDV